MPPRPCWSTATTVERRRATTPPEGPIQLMKSALLQQIIDGMPHDFADPHDDHRVTREKMAPLHGHPLLPDTSVTLAEIGAVGTGLLTRPTSDADRGLIVFFHGGAFVSCDLQSYLFFAESIAEQVGVPVLTIDYRLAPEHLFPAALDDCLSVVAGLAELGPIHDRLVFLGDSCGGGLALSTAMLRRDAGQPLPRGVVSLSGWVDLDTRGYPAGGSVSRDPFITEGFLRARARDYLGPKGDLRDPRASPARGSLGGLPPLLLQVGETDACRADAEHLTGSALAAGVDAQLDVVAGGVHGVQGLVNLGVPEAVAAWESVRRFTGAVLAG
jgi:epsilon-lactone hydrolase